jgi:hypothetical protein
MMYRLVTVASLTLVACSIEPPPFTCHEHAECVNDGVQGFCEADTARCSFPDSACETSGRRYGDLAGESSGDCVQIACDSSLDATGPSCPVSSIRDDFEDGIQDDIWQSSYADDGASLSEVGGEVILALADNNIAWAAYMTGGAYDLRDGHISVGVTGMVDTSTTALAYLTLQVANDPAHQFGIYQTAGEVFCDIDTPADEAPYGHRPYSASAQRYWRLRAAGDQLFCEVSADGDHWSSLGGGHTAPFPVEHVQLVLGAGTWEAVPQPGSVRFDEFNLR